MSTKTAVTAEELARTPLDGRCELVEGEIVRLPPTGWNHMVSSSRFDRMIGAYADEHRLGVTGTAEGGFLVRRDPDTVRAPDVAFVSTERIPEGGFGNDYVPFAPDLAVEILSPGNTSTEIARKVAEYLSAGSRLVWVADYRARTVTVHAPGREPRTLGPDDLLGGEDVLPGFSVRVGDIFAPGL